MVINSPVNFINFTISLTMHRPGPPSNSGGWFYPLCRACYIQSREPNWMARQYKSKLHDYNKSGSLLSKAFWPSAIGYQSSARKVGSSAGRSNLIAGASSSSSSCTLFPLPYSLLPAPFFRSATQLA